MPAGFLFCMVLGFQRPKAATGVLLYKRLFFKNRQYSQENTSLYLDLQLCLKEIPTQVLSREYCKIFKSKYFEEYPRTVLPLNVAALFLDKVHRRKLLVLNLVNLSFQLHYLNYVFPDAVVILSVLMRVKEVVFVYSRRDIYWYILIGNLLWSNKQTEIWVMRFLGNEV